MSKNQAVGLSSAIAKSVFLAAAAAVFLQGCGGCSGFDPSALSLEGRVINYSKRLEQDPPPTAAIIYGKLSPRSSTAISGNALQGEYKGMVQELDNIVALAETEPQRNALLAWSSRIKGAAHKDIEPLLPVAASDSAKALELALKLQDLLKVGGKLEAERAPAAAQIPAGSLQVFDQIYGRLVSSVGRLYQVAILTANRLEQDRARKHVADINDRLKDLKNIIDRRIDVVAEVDRQNAVKSIQGAEVFARAIGTPLEGMDNRDVVEPTLGKISGEIIGAINTSVINIKADYLDKAASPAIKAELQPKYDELVGSATALLSLAKGYESIEKTTKATADDNLKVLVIKAFLGADGMAPMIGATIDHETDINHLASALGRSDVVVLEDNDNSLNMVYALASAVASNVAKLYGLPDAINVVGPDHERISQDQTDFVMDNAQFNIYLESLGEKIRADAQNSVYVVFADRYPKDAKVSLLIEGLSKDKGKVVVITKNTSAFKGELFSPHGLSLSETILVADKMLKDENLSVDTAVVGDRLARFFTAYGHVSMSKLAPIVKDVAAKLRAGSAGIDEAGIQAVVIGSLAAKDIRVGAQRSTLLSASVKEVENQMRKNPLFYQEVAPPSGGGASVLSAEINAIKNAQIRAKEEAEARAAADLELEKIKAALAAMDRAARDKRDNAFAARQRLEQALEEKKAGIEKAIDQIDRTAEACSIRKVDFGTFGDGLRGRFLNLVFDPAADPAALPIIQGKPMLGRTMDLTYASCLITNFRSRNKIRERLQEAKTVVASAIGGLKDASSACLDGGSPTAADMEKCLLNATTAFDSSRKRMIEGGEGYLRTIAQEVPLYPPYPPEASEGFWKSSTRPNISLAGNPVNPGSFASMASFSNEKKYAYRSLARQYYIRALLEIFGSSGGKVLGMDLKNISAGTRDRYLFLKQLLRDFQDNDSLMVKARREINKEYHHFLEDRIAHMISEGMVRDLYKDVIMPFWQLVPAKLPRFYADPALLKPAWDRMASLSGVVERLALTLGKKFVDPGDGDARVGKAEALRELEGELENLKNAVVGLQDDFARVGIPSSALDQYIAKAENLSLKLKKAFESAYDVAMYNEPNLDGRLRSRDALRTRALDRPIKHPLDP